MGELFSNNRKRFSEKMSAGSVLIMFAGSQILKRSDEYYDFAPPANFYYLTGIDSPEVIMVLHKKADGSVDETLFLEPYDAHLAKWVGPVLSKEKALEKSGIKDCRLIKDFEQFITGIIFRNNVETVYMDLEKRYWKARTYRDVEFAGELSQKFPHVTIKNAYRILTDLRMIKSEEEIELIRKGLAVTKEGIEMMLKHMKPGMMEYQIEAYFLFALHKAGAKEAFKTIAGSGINGTILHYEDKNCEAKDGDLILFDLGGSVGHYRTDISRTFPVNGKFTERQKQMYNIVLEAQEIAISLMKPGLPHKAVNEAVIDHYYEELKKLGMVETKEDVSKYYFHGCAHMVGLETHDADYGEHNFEPGMVYTIEPGLYLSDEGFGIRIEDDVLITETGNEVLSKDILKTVEEIEAFMGK